MLVNYQMNLFPFFHYMKVWIKELEYWNNQVEDLLKNMLLKRYAI